MPNFHDPTGDPQQPLGPDLSEFEGQRSTHVAQPAAANPGAAQNAGAAPQQPGGPKPPRSNRGLIIGGGIAAGAVFVAAAVGIGVVALGGPSEEEQARDTLVAQVRTDVIAKYPPGTDVSGDYAMVPEGLTADKNRPLKVVRFGEPRVGQMTTSEAKLTIPVVLEQKASVPTIYRDGETPLTNRIRVDLQYTPYDFGGSGTWTLQGQTAKLVGYEGKRRPVPGDADLADAEKTASTLVRAAMTRPVGQSSGKYNAAQPADGYLTKKMTKRQIDTVIKRYSGYEAMGYPPALDARGDGAFGAFTSSLLIDEQYVCFGNQTIRRSSVQVGAWKDVPRYDDASAQEFEESETNDLQHVRVEAPITISLGLKCSETLGGEKPPSSITVRDTVSVLLARPADERLDGRWRAEEIKLSDSSAQIYAPMFDFGDYSKIRR